MSGSALAEAAGISRSLASAHLKKLVAGGLVRAQPSGRQQLYSIASEPVADALEILILLAPATKARSLGDASRARSLRWARMCYDHLAGAVGVSVTEALIGRGLVTAERRRWLRAGPGRARRSSAASASTWTGWSGGPGRCCGPAWTGASAAITWPAAWAPP